MTKIVFSIGAGLLLLLLFFMASATKPSKTIDITLNNPYGFDLDLEVKCDWNNSAKAFLFQTKITVPAKRAIQVRLPSWHKKCEIWPKVRFF